MKSYRIILLAALAALPLAAACNKENAEPGIGPDEAGLVPLTLSATGETEAEEGEDTPKVTFTDANNARWENSDHIAVFDGSGKRNFSLRSGTNTGATARFEGNVSAGYSNLYTVYPYSAANSLSGSNVRVTVPSVQTVSSSNRVDPSAIVSVGKVNTSTMSVAFKQVCGLVSFQIASNDIYKVIIEGTNLAGTATVVPTTGVITGAVSSGVNKIEIGYTGGGNFATGKYYAAVLPGTSAEYEFAVSFVHADGITHRKSVSTAVTIARKGRKAAGSVTVENPKIRHIYNKAQLDAWGAGMVDDEQYFTVYLDADIDYGSATWPYTANDTHFNGNFKGQNHKIYNIHVESTTNTSFLTGLYGSLNDVIFGSSDGVNWDGKSYIMHTGNAGAVEYVGLVGEMRANNASFMTNVNNFAPVYVPSGYNTRAYIGGLVGHIQSGKTVTMTDCKNYASVSNSSSWTGDPTRMGGILGQCDGALIGSGLENHGGLTVNNAKTTFIGGLCGDLGSGSKLTGCKNYGSIVFSDSGTSETYFGGCCGSVRGSIISDCHNYAAISATRNAKQWFGGILGLFESGKTTVTACTNHSGANLEISSSVTSNLIRMMGGIAGGCGYNGSGPFGITIQDCVNEANITNNGGGTHFGGIAGQFDNYYASATIQIQNCVNYGAVASKTADNTINIAQELRVGGILGMIDPESSGCRQTIQSCVNQGNVSVSGTLKSGASVRFGGIVGHAYNDATIDKCKNFGNVSIDAAGADAGNAVFYVGGILGFINTRSSTRYQQITDCVNTGAVSSVRTYSNHYLGGIIGSGTNADAYPVISGCKNYGAISDVKNANTILGGVCGYTCFQLTNDYDFGNVSGGEYNGAVYGDNNSKSVNSGCKVGSGVVVNGVAAPAVGSYSFASGSQTGKDWFTGWNGNSAMTVQVIGQESYSGSTDPEETGTGGYLFAHTGNGDGKYYRLYYAISHDGLSWTVLNGGASPMPTYYGFPYITQDDNGIFWLIGVSDSTPRNPVVWCSTDCVTWTVAKSIPASVFALPSAYGNDTNSYGAIKIFHDPVSKQFVLTWHAGEKDKSDDDYWESMCTFYVLTSDFETFTTAQKLFPAGTPGHIDVSLHYYGGRYYALYKHELTYDSDKSYYKRPRMRSSSSLTGTYSLVASNNYLTPRHREGPTMVKSPDNTKWYLYVENYHDDAHVYELYYSTSLTASGPWTQNTSTFAPPANANGCRHGCVVPIDAKTYRRLENSY